jgi:hypothetical protein
LQARPCRFGTLPARAEALAPTDATLGLVSRPRDWSGQALLAEHTARDVVVAEELAALPERVGIALTVGDVGAPDGWQAIAREGRTALLIRRR